MANQTWRVSDGVSFFPVRLIENSDGTYSLAVSTSGDVSGLAFGQNSDVDTSAEVLGASTPCKEVLVQAANANTGIISVGDSGSQTFELAAGQSIALPTTNVNLIYVKADTTNQVVNWIAKI